MVRLAKQDMPMPVSDDPSPKSPPPNIVELQTAKWRVPSWNIERPDDWKPNMVEHPPHYNQGNMEAIDIIEAVGLGYHLSNALKYLIRSPYKGHEEEDLKKAIWYIQRHIDRNINA